ncbi:hypothetical protein [Staphylococcus capitis]|uniref:hypothetical protein n=1 Tax=Staphylococcus capitis TaxID=29388 RepID=UPI0030C23BA3
MNKDYNLDNAIKEVDKSVIDNFRFLLETIIDFDYTSDDFLKFKTKAIELMELYEENEGYDLKYQEEMRQLYQKLHGIESSVTAEFLSQAFEEGAGI